MDLTAANAAKSCGSWLTAVAYGMEPVTATREALQRGSA